MRSVFLALFSFMIGATSALGASVDLTSRYAWGENIGWIDFGSTDGAVDVASSALTGYAWGENVGWISLSCSNTSSCATVDYGVTKSGSTIAGYAWGENVGWISFNCSNTSSCATVDYGVTFNISTGYFAGYAWGENVGWISFNCSNTSSCATVDYGVLSSVAVATATPSSRVGGAPGSAVVAEASEDKPSVSPPVQIPNASTSPVLPDDDIVAPLPSAGPLEPPSASVQPQTGPGTSGGVQASSDSSPLEVVASTVAGMLDDISLIIEQIANEIAQDSCSGVVGATACTTTAIATVAVVAVVVAGLEAGPIVQALLLILVALGLRKKAGAMVPVDIPIDAQAVARVSEHSLGLWWRILLDRVIATVIVLGFITVPLVYLDEPSTGRLALLVVFAIASSIWTFVLYRPFGVVRDRETGKPLAFALITLTNEMGKRVAMAVADKYGRYQISAPQGHVYDMGVFGPVGSEGQRVTHQQISLGVGLGGTSWVTSTIHA